MLPPHVSEEVFEVMTICELAIVLGLISGVFAVHILMTSKGQLGIDCNPSPNPLCDGTSVKGSSPDYESAS